ASRVQRLALFRVELRDDVLLLGEVLEGAEVDVLVALADAGGRDHAAERRDRAERPCRRADAERRELEEDAARVARSLLGPSLLDDKFENGLRLGSRLGSS